MSKPRMSKPRPISAKPLSVMLNDVFSDVYARQGFASRELVTRWAEIAGPEIAAHAEPLKMQWPRPVEGQPHLAHPPAMAPGGVTAHEGTSQWGPGGNAPPGEQPFDPPPPRLHRRPVADRPCCARRTFAAAADRRGHGAKRLRCRQAGVA